MEIDYTVKYSRRMTIALNVKEGKLVVRAPFWCSTEYIDTLIQKKMDWIIKNIAITKKTAELREAFSLSYGDKIFYLGKEYPIVPRDGKTIGFDGTFFMPPGYTSEWIKLVCIEIYKSLAKELLTDKVNELAELFNLQHAGVRITNAKKRWGSCSSEKRLNFSWRLVMADEDLVNYVVVHEMAHLIEMNHSAYFWALVEELIPDHKERRQRLNALNKQLSIKHW